MRQICAESHQFIPEIPITKTIPIVKRADLVHKQRFRLQLMASTVGPINQARRQQAGRSKAGPRITLIMPSFNQAQYLEEAICSVLDQHYQDLEFMILDGGSNDGSREIITRYSRALAYWQSRRDEGQTDALIQGFSRSTGDLLGWVNSDDILLPGAIHKVAAAWAARPDAGFFGGNYVLIDENGLVTRCKRHPSQAAWWARRGIMAVNQPGSFFGRQTYESLGGLQRDLQYVMDTEFYVRMLLSGVRFVYIDDWLSGFRKHASAKTVADWDRAQPEHYRALAPYWKSRIPLRAGHDLWRYVFRGWQALNGNYLRMATATRRANGMHWRTWAEINVSATGQLGRKTNTRVERVKH